jgi:hypothetical protein
MENTATSEASVDNSVAQTGSTGTKSATPVETSVSTSTGWKSGIRTDLRDSPLLQKFEDTPQGLEKALESHANLEKLLGHEKVPIPKDVNDVEGWNRFQKAMGIPDKAEGYGLSDPALPDAMKDVSFDKSKFAEIAHAHKLTPAQAKGLWETYTKSAVDQYADFQKTQQDQLSKTINELKGTWGDAYQTNVELGQMVINKFSSDQAMNDYLTATLSKDPRGIKFLAKVGDQFAENKVGEFSMKRFTLAPEQAREEWQKIARDPNHAYNSEKSTPREREAAIEYVNSLIRTVNKGQG